MRNLFTCLLSLFLILAFARQSFAQQTQAASTASGTSASPVPSLIKFCGVLLDHQGEPLKGPVGVTFPQWLQCPVSAVALNRYAVGGEATVVSVRQLSKLRGGTSQLGISSK